MCHIGNQHAIILIVRIELLECYLTIEYGLKDIKDLGRMAPFNSEVHEIGEIIMATKGKIRKYPKAGTIGRITLDALSKNPDLKTEDILPEILKKFPDSKFNPAHLAWYKHQVKVGNYLLPKASKVSKPKKAGKAKAKKS